MPSTSNNDLQFSTNPHDWLYSQACGVPVNPFDSVYDGYYIVDKNKEKKKKQQNHFGSLKLPIATIDRMASRACHYYQLNGLYTPTRATTSGTD
ncbi:hypothetical protein BDD12DRAFT_875754 [Trichophaea hybrida]|nr:hypothetical protein BDD12DRAFT_875754 [Trichophaea hybrida]